VDNPFKELIAQRHIKEQEIRKNEKQDRKQQYDSQVRAILQHLQVAAYPEYHVGGLFEQSSKIEPYYNDMIWRIVRHFKDEEDRDYTDVKVQVCLEVNAFGEYESFLVTRQNAVDVRCGLSAEELINALKQLHPLS
jgi:hypothetical protein